MILRAPKWKGTSLRGLRGRRRGFGDVNLTELYPFTSFGGGTSSGAGSSASYGVDSTDVDLTKLYPMLQLALNRQQQQSSPQPSTGSITDWITANPLLAAGLGLIGAVVIGKAVR